MGPKRQTPDRGTQEGNSAKKMIVCRVSITATLIVALLGMAGIITWLKVFATQDEDAIGF